MFDYKVVVAGSVYQLEKEVKQYLNDGYVPVGGVYYDNMGEWLYQAVMKYDTISITTAFANMDSDNELQY